MQGGGASGPASGALSQAAWPPPARWLAAVEAGWLLRKLHRTLPRSPTPPFAPPPLHCRSLTALPLPADAPAAATAAFAITACQLCGRPAVLACPGCGAFAYCGERHRAAHWRRCGHADECARLAEQVTRRQELAAHPFPWAAGTHALPPCAWLHQLGLHAPAADPPTAWLRECPCGGPSAAPWGAAAPLLAQLRAGGGGPVVLSRAELLELLGSGWLALPPGQAPCLLSQVRSWEGWARWRLGTLAAWPN